MLGLNNLLHFFAAESESQQTVQGFRLTPSQPGNISAEAVIDRVVHPGKEWRVRYQASFWKARAVGPQMDLAPGDRVRVVGRHNLALLIQDSPLARHVVAPSV
ncbi:MAG: hypothetical protein AAF215_07255 [Cyanobacteria bacterium P01_A01_bin.123]